MTDSSRLLVSHSPIDGKEIGRVEASGPEAIDRAAAAAVAAFRAWRCVPPPRRGAVVLELGRAVQAAKESLAEIVTREVGKIRSEALGEVQEVVDICEFASGLSRQLHGLTIASERARHHMLERWHPLGPTAIITAFNFPMAVWGWNAALALVCGNSIVWKPSDKAPLCAEALHEVLLSVLERADDAPRGLSTVLHGGREVGGALSEDPRFPLVSATGSTAMGREVGSRVADRFGRSLLELGGNNATVVTPSARLDLAVRAITFAAVGTAGQRCTTLRRLIVHESVRHPLLERLRSVYAALEIGDPNAPDVLVGPLIDGTAFARMQDALEQARAEGATVWGGERVDTGHGPDVWYVRPAIVSSEHTLDVSRRETFAPILYVQPYGEFDEAVALCNEVSQGLSSSVITENLGESERFLSAEGSDCGLANVNVGTTGAEIGGAFGGEKETGGGRESGSDAWKAYMRRQTQVVNWSGALPLAQGVRFDIEV